MTVCSRRPQLEEIGKLPTDAPPRPDALHAHSPPNPLFCTAVANHTSEAVPSSIAEASGAVPSASPWTRFWPITASGAVPSPIAAASGVVSSASPRYLLTLHCNFFATHLVPARLQSTFDPADLQARASNACTSSPLPPWSRYTDSVTNYP